MISTGTEKELFCETPSMQDFYQSFGLKDYPFNVYTAENETQFSSMLFIHPLNYDAIKSSFDGNRSIIIRGNRGTGKTALLVDLQQNIGDDALFCVIDDYSELQVPPTTSEYYTILIKNLVSALFLKLFNETERLKKLNKDDKLFLSFLLGEYTSPITQRELVRKIETIQLSKLQRFLKNKANLIRAILNYGLTAGLNVVNDIIRNYYAGLPPIDESKVRDIIPKLDIEAETEFNASAASYQLLLRICALIDKLGYKKITAFFDKFDEDSRMENNAEIVSEFIMPLLTDNKLLENTSIQIIVSVWEVPFGRILSSVRTQKHHCPQLSWPIPKLMDALNTRIAVFSNSSIRDFRNLFSKDVNSESLDEIFYLCNGNPRDLWHIFDRIFQAQYTLDARSHVLSQCAITNGLDNFVTTFNFYEYYPRKINARASSMDVYGYIKHLLKLSSEEFTKNQLNDAAKIGGSINNYVVGMENIGLVAKTNEKYKGGVIYRINDPKVVYAIKNKLDITK